MVENTESKPDMEIVKQLTAQVAALRAENAELRQTCIALEVTVRMQARLVAPPVLGAVPAGGRT